MTLPNPQFWRGRRVMVTGHTGFMGGWLALWLTQMGAKVTGYGLAPAYQLGIFGATNLAARMTSVTADIRDGLRFRQCVQLMRPEIVFHLAAQSHNHGEDAVEIYDTNIMGTARLLENLRWFPPVRAVVVATSDKVYENRGEGRPLREDDRLGGFGPVGASKASVEMVTEAFRQSLDATRDLAVMSVRAGHVIGGGDWTQNRLVPDAMKAFTAGEPFMVRAPYAVRPWQYVLDPLCGYLLLAERLLDRTTDDLPMWRSGWNFGADVQEAIPVREMADRLVTFWNSHDMPAYTAMASWEQAGQAYDDDEMEFPGIDSSKARLMLNWYPRMSPDKALAAAVDWYKAQQRGENMAMYSAAALDDYLNTPLRA